MLRHSIFAAAVLALALGAAPVHAGTLKVPALAHTLVPVTFEAAPYYPAGALAPELLPPPPEENSAVWKKDIAAVAAAQKHIPSDDMTALVDEQHLQLSHVTSVVSAQLTPEGYPAVFHLLERVARTSESAAAKAKKFWHTNRPYLVSKKVKLLVNPVDESPAYPSGHTAESRLLAETLGLLFPGRLDALRERADKIAWHRVQAGVHYPADLAGGRTLAAIMLGSLLNDDEFQQDLAAAATEINDKPFF